MKQKTILIVLSIVVFLLAIYAFSPLLYDKKVDERIQDIKVSTGNSVETQPAVSEPKAEAAQENIVTLSQGDFAGVGGHNGKGTAKLLKSGSNYFVRLEDNFEVTNGPDLYVYLGNNNQYDPETEIGRLKGNIGGQNYEIPTNIDASKYSEVWIWCKAFSVEFAKAELE